jgi:hypothetical protein
MGTGRYKFENGAVKTATEVISDKSDLYQSLKKHEIVVESALKGLVGAVAQLTGKQIKDINVDFDDSIIEDKETERQTDKGDIAIGAMTLIDYRMKWYGETEEEALKHINEPVVFGEVANDNVAALSDINGREFLILLLLAVSVLWMGVYPKPVSNLMDASVKQLIQHVQQSKLPIAAAAQ